MCARASDRSVHGFYEGACSAFINTEATWKKQLNPRAPVQAKSRDDLIGGIFKYFDNKYLTEDDTARAATLQMEDMAMSTDGFIVSPAEFPGRAHRKARYAVR